MRQPHQTGALALTVALTVWATECVFAALREMAYGGLADILGPWMIGISIVSVAFAVAGALGSWRALRTGGRSADVAVIGGICVVLGTLIILGSGFRPERSSFVVATTAVGLMVETAGWGLAGWGTHLGRQHAGRT
jgi:hypothetical protein